MGFASSIRVRASLFLGSASFRCSVYNISDFRIMPLGYDICCRSAYMVPVDDTAGSVS